MWKSTRNYQAYTHYVIIPFHPFHAICLDMKMDWDFELTRRESKEQQNLPLKWYVSKSSKYSLVFRVLLRIPSFDHHLKSQVNVQSAKCQQPSRMSGRYVSGLTCEKNDTKSTSVVNWRTTGHEKSNQ